MMHPTAKVSEELNRKCPTRNTLYGRVVFLVGHFLFNSSDTFAAGCIIQPQHTAKNRIAEISAS